MKSFLVLLSTLFIISGSFCRDTPIVLDKTISRILLPPPTVTTSTPIEITSTGCLTGGQVTSSGGLTITEAGICYGTTQNPTTSNNVIRSNCNLNSFSIRISTNLVSNTIYYIRAYARNSDGTSYGNQVQFSTVAGLPTVTTNTITNIGGQTATSGGNVTNEGGFTVTSRGICYATTQNPNTSNTTILSGSGSGQFTSNLTSLQPVTTYYVRAFATNSQGTSYGNQQQFTTTTSANFPTVTTRVSDINGVNVTSGGTVTSAGTSAVTSRGVIWSVSPNDITLDLPTKIFSGTGTGSFTVNINDLNSNTLYHIKAFATNSSGTSYGDLQSALTSVPTTSVPVLTTTNITSITSSSANSGGEISSGGGSNITSKGVVWSTNPSPTIALTTKTNNGTGTSLFTSQLTNLNPGTLYYVRSYAQNSTGVGYGNQLTFTTTSNTTPTVTTTSVTVFSSTSATMGGNVTSSGGGTVTRRGICYSTTTNPDLTSNVIDIGTGTGTFSQNITGLVTGTIYYVRAFAQNSFGTSFGAQQSFQTLSTPTVTTASTTNIGQTTATSGGNVTSAGGGSLTVTSRGVCYSTSPNPNILNNTVSGGSGVGTFTCALSGLTPGQLYYVRAFATNSIGTSYGQETSFTTTNLPTVTTTPASSVTSTSATTGGNVVSAGGESLTITERGICYSFNQNPTTSDNKVLAPTPTGIGSYTINLTGLSPGNVYFVRAYAINSLGTAYGNQISFTTNNIPVLTTNSVTSIGTTTAVSGGNISSSVGSSVSNRGVVWSTSPSPTISLSTKTSDGTGTGSFTSNISGLTPSTLYYIRSFATNTSGTGYGDQLTFTTTSAGTTPTVTTSTASNITQTTAQSGGNVTSDGGASVTSRGICYATTQNPNLSNTVITSGSGTGSFVVNLTGLSPNTIYYVRAFATNQNGTSFGSQISFTTLQNITLPTVLTTIITSITSTTATGGGNVTSDGGASVTSRGICYSISPNPTITNNVITSGSGLGTFSTPISGLTSGVTYYVRSFATNSLGTSYGSEVIFSTLTLPSVTTTTATSITTNSAQTGGNVTSDGGTSVSARGVCFSTSPNPTLANSFTSDGSGTGSFTSSLSSLSSNTQYYVRAYATNSVGTNYGNQITFTTSTGVQLPTVTTTSVTSVTQNSAISGGNVTSSGSQPVTSRGVCWSTSPNPTISNSRTQNGSGTGSFSSTISSLTPSTLYYVRAYATSSAGTSYGSQISFTTTSSGGNSCIVNNLSAYKPSTLWRFKWDINPNCTNYTVTVSRFNFQNINIPPPIGATPTASGVRLNNYVPTPTEISQGFIDKEMNPQPALTGYWYRFEVRCNSGNCSGTNITQSNYFYNP